MSARVLEGCLQSVRNQRFRDLEVIVIDNFSNDGTRPIAEQFGARVILEEGTQAAAKNRGLLEASGVYILFLDADQRLEREAIDECAKLAEDDVDAVKLPEVFLGHDFWTRASALWRNNVSETQGPKYWIPRFYRKSLLIEISGFESDLRLWDDYELYERALRTGMKTRISSSRILHEEQLFLTKYLRYGRSSGRFLMRNQRPPIVSTIILTLRVLKKLLSKRTASIRLLIACIILTCVKSGLAAIGVILAIMDRRSRKN
jgi:glycosyltransferase involved in cell wall biosynthesis